MRGEIFFESFWKRVIVNMMGEEIFLWGGAEAPGTVAFWLQ